MNTRFAIPILLFLAAAPAVATAAAAEAPPGAAATTTNRLEWTRKVEFGLLYNDGNTDTTDINYGFELGVAGKTDWIKWTLSGVWGEDRSLDGEDETKNKIAYLLKYEHQFTPRQAANLGLAYLYDKFAFVDYSYILSPAYSFYFIKNDRLELSTEAGPALVWRKEDDQKNDYVTLRIAENLKWVISETATFTQTLEYLPELDGAHGTLINLDAALTTTITPLCGLKLALTDKYNSAPADNAEENDLSLSISLTFTL